MPRRDLTVPPRYDPWRDLTVNWPEVVVRVARLPGDLLGVVTYPVIVLRAGTSAAQQRSTLAHEIVHLERGIEACDAGSRWAAREEAAVEAEAARRLIRVRDLASAVRELGTRPPLPAVAALLEVDSQLLHGRLAGLDPDERDLVCALTADDFSAA